jgi:dihydrofolate reductase
MRRIIISAMAPNRAIGFEGRLPWSIPNEYAHFLRSIQGKTMVMGRKSWDVFGADAKTIANVVITRSKSVPGATEVAPDLTTALSLAAEYGEDIFIAGGGRTYSEAIGSGQYDEIWLSTVKVEVEGDVFFPALDEAQVVCVTREDHPDYFLEKWIKK